jgi:hypothetical protein
MVVEGEAKWGEQRRVADAAGRWRMDAATMDGGTVDMAVVADGAVKAAAMVGEWGMFWTTRRQMSWGAESAEDLPLVRLAEKP